MMMYSKEWYMENLPEEHLGRSHVIYVFCPIWDYVKSNGLKQVKELEVLYIGPIGSAEAIHVTAMCSVT